MSGGTFCTGGHPALRHRIVCGINDDNIQKRLLAEAKFTYAKALELAQGLETAARNVKEISYKETASPYTPTRNGQQEVYKVTPERKAELSCYRCGKAGHDASKCRFKRGQMPQVRKNWTSAESLP